MLEASGPREDLAGSMGNAESREFATGSFQHGLNDHESTPLGPKVRKSAFQIPLLLSILISTGTTSHKAGLSVLYDILDTLTLFQATSSDVYDATMVKGRTALCLPMVLVLKLADLKLAEEPSTSPLLPCVLALSRTEQSSMGAFEGRSPRLHM